MDTLVRSYLSQLGRRGGIKSRRSLSAEDARDMVKVREAKRAFRRYYTRCFWSHDPNYPIQKKNIPWVAEQLRKYGDREAWRIAAKLCR